MRVGANQQYVGQAVCGSLEMPTGYVGCTVASSSLISEGYVRLLPYLIFLELENLQCLYMQLAYLQCC